MKGLVFTILSFLPNGSQQREGNPKCKTSKLRQKKKEKSRFLGHVWNVR